MLCRPTEHLAKVTIVDEVNGGGGGGGGVGGQWEKLVMDCK